MSSAERVLLWKYRMRPDKAWTQPTPAPDEAPGWAGPPWRKREATEQAQG